MRYSVIYSVDVPCDCDPLDYAPPKVNKLWDQTEGDEQYELSYLEGCWEREATASGARILTEAQFRSFVEHCGLVGGPDRNDGQSRCTRFRVWLVASHLLRVEQFRCSPERLRDADPREQEAWQARLEAGEGPGAGDVWLIFTGPIPTFGIELDTN